MPIKIDEKRKEYMRVWMKAYRKTAKNKEYVRKYRQTKAYKERAKKLEKSEAVKQYRRAYRTTWDYFRSEKYRTKQKNRRVNDIQFRLSVQLRVRLWQAVKTDSKQGSAVKELGCSIEELKKHLEKQFSKGMTWKNWSRYGWHIDHIRPLSSFNLKNKDEFLQAVNYKNLRPLWSKDNLIKGKTWKK